MQKGLIPRITYIVFMTIRGLSFFTGMGAMILVGGHLRKKWVSQALTKFVPTHRQLAENAPPQNIRLPGHK